VFGPVARKRIGVAVSILLLTVVTVTFLTGFVAAALDLNRFAYHRYAAYLAIALAATHVLLHRRSLAGQIRRWVLGHAPTRCPSAIQQAVGPTRLTRRALLSPGVALAAGAGIGGWWATRGATEGLVEGEDLGQVYHQWSKPTYVGALFKSLHIRPQPPLYKDYPEARVLPLPPVSKPGGLPVEVVLARRRSVREYAERPVTVAELSQLLQFSAGITDRRDPALAFRAVPSSGALFPIEVFPIVCDVVGLAPGVYHYAVERHALELLRTGDFRQEVFEAGLSQEMLKHASFVLALTGVFARVQWKYIDRSYRYILLEAGHLGENVYLVATSLGLAPCGIGAYFDDDINRLLGVDGRDRRQVGVVSPDDPRFASNGVPIQDLCAQPVGASSATRSAAAPKRCESYPV
jgi:SagB-type dehydrogenase family enzyme